MPSQKLPSASFKIESSLLHKIRSNSFPTLSLQSSSKEFRLFSRTTFRSHLPKTTFLCAISWPSLPRWYFPPVCRSGPILRSSEGVVLEPCHGNSFRDGQLGRCFPVSQRIARKVFSGFPEKLWSCTSGLRRIVGMGSSQVFPYSQRSSKGVPPLYVSVQRNKVFAFEA